MFKVLAARAGGLEWVVRSHLIAGGHEQSPVMLALEGKDTASPSKLASKTGWGALGLIKKKCLCE